MLVLIVMATSKHGVPTAKAAASDGPPVPYNLGNWTYMSKPVHPAKINASQIPIGGNWTYVYTLSNASKYHVYFYGDWINSTTDYDVYVYDPLGRLEAVHTEAAGLPEHLGTTVTDPFFTPKFSGNYSFLIVNDPRESEGAEAATLMLIEHVECNRWYERYLQGKVNFAHVYYTTWAYEFASNKENIQVLIDVPERLDMYEARLYVMADPSRNMGDVLNGVPLAWEPGLYNETDASGVYGGYNLEDEGFKHDDATASCEHFGQDMLINYTSPFKGETVLYHLVLIGENGQGTLRFMVKTDFNPPTIKVLTPIQEACSGNETRIKVNVTDEDCLKSIAMYYTNDNWQTSIPVPLAETSNQTYIGVIPGQTAGNIVRYKIVAVDMAGNKAEAGGSYVVKDKTTMTFSVSDTAVYVNEKITVRGYVSHGSFILTLNYTSGNKTVLRYVNVDQTGFFIDEYVPDGTGNWTVSAYWQGDNSHFGVFSGYKNFTVQKIPTSIDYAISSRAIDIGGKITVTGRILPAIEGKAVELRFVIPNGSFIKRYAYASSNGTFTAGFTPHLVGSWSVEIHLAGDDIYLPSTSESKEFIVKNTWMNMIMSFLNAYMIYIIAAVGAAASASGFLIYWRRRE